MNRKIRTAAVTLAATAAALAGLTAPAMTAAHAATSVPHFDHVLVVIEENHAYNEIIGSSSAPYINNLASQGAVFTQSFAVTHPSEPNYLELFSGSTQGTTSDSCPHTFSGPDLGGEALAAGDSFTGYSESMPSDGYTGCTSGEYARKHNPWSFFSDVPAADNRTFGAYPSDYTTLPKLGFVVPNLLDDMHDGTIQQGDSWLQSNIDGYAQWAKTHNSLLVVTWDEDDSSESNQIPTLMVGAGVTPGQYSENITHDNVLRTLEDSLGVAATGNAASATPITDVFGGTPANTVTVTNPGTQSSTVGTAASVQVAASDSASGQTLTYGATGLPAGLSINSSTGLISGTPTTAGTSTVTVTATDPTGASGSTSFTWTVNAQQTETVSVTNPGNQTGTVGTAVSSVQVSANDSAGKALSYSATGLPAGLSISSSGLISGTPTAAGTSNVTVTATSGTASGSASFTWTVNPSGGGCTSPGQKLGNPGFETGSESPWTMTSGVLNNDTTSEPAHSGSWDAWLDGYGAAHTDTLAQSVAVPAGCSSTFSFWLHVDSDKTGTTASDTLKVQVLNSAGTVLSTPGTYSNLNAASGYTQYSFNLSAYAGQTVTLKFTGVEGSGAQTSFVVDDTALNAS
ncbi:putative Ig domain-containing protein [Streptacidiphilus jiangxiensis]|uniref:Putative Ig domain-containing protein n=1 Tax=Streptacidiphilus jiangxiensis TaxID=235985 RepID=A0A1H7V440_STRJI|nr:putative Ig domain-containing protein [Streptacidiphilus jiangxiensis]SEM03884.1 Putative Ig domain-containing protein [Streptacidiphilus jiangxiensis]